MPPPGSGAGHARSLGVKDRAADADDRDRDQDQRVGAGEGEQREADQRKGHARGQNSVHRSPVEAHTDQRLEERGRDLEDEGDRSDLEERQRELVPKHRIERRRQRLHRVVEHVRRAERRDHADGRGRLGLGAGTRTVVHVGRRCRQIESPPAAAGRRTAGAVSIRRNARRGPSRAFDFATSAREP